MFVRSIVGIASIAFGASLPAMSNESLESMSRLHDADLSREDEDGQENPLLELDAERNYKSEALLSYKSTLAPYGKLVGIRTTSERTFTVVRTWKDVEEFISKNSDERVIVKLLEPWGTELVTGVTVNRKSYPGSIVRPVDPPKEAPARDPFEKTADGPKAPDLTPVSPAVSIPSGEAKAGRVSTESNPLRAEYVAIEPRSPSMRSRARTTPQGQFAYEATLLSLAVFGPHSRVEVPSEPTKSPSRSASKAIAIGVSVAVRPEVKANLLSDEDGWLRESLDLADRLGLLSAKPLVTSDRRQRAFAIYTLYMALKELRMQVDLDAQRLNAALDRLSANQTPGETEHSSIVAMARSFEKSMTGIMMWDAESMKSAVRGYTAELQAMDNARGMLAFLSRVKRQPEISIGYRAYVGGTETQD